jgi:hypothetical protein
MNEDIFSPANARDLVLNLARYEQLSGFMGVTLEDVLQMTVGDLLHDLVEPMSKDEQVELARMAEADENLNPRHSPFFLALPISIRELLV